MAFEGEAGAGAGAAAGDGGAAAAAALFGGAGGDAGAGAGAGDGGAGAGEAGAGAGDGGGAVDPDWFENLSADAAEGESASNRDWARSRGVKSLDDLVKGFRDTQRALHDKGAVKVPGDGATPEEIGAFHRSIGVPETADGYAIAAPNGADGQPLPLNDGLIKLVTEAGVKFGVPKAALEGVLGEVLKGDLDAMAQHSRQQDEAAAKWQKDQGGALAEKTAAVNRAAEALGLTAQDLGSLRAAWGAEKALTVMAKLGEGLAEDKLIGGGKGKFGVSGAEAQAELARLKQDADFVKKAMIKGSPENARWNRLNDAVAEHLTREAGEGG